MARLRAEDAEAPLRILPGWSSLQFVAKGVRADAFSPEEAAAYLREGRGDEAPSVLETAESVHTFMLAEDGSANPSRPRSA
jgi:hypothetical protein